MRIVYLYHDCFLLETEECCVLTDCFDGVPASSFDLIDPEKRLYVLVSHHHKDHFSPAVFSLWRRFPKVEYVISADTRRAAGYLLKPGSTYAGRNALDDPGRVHVLRPGERYSDPMLTVDAFGSTDIGDSYALTLGGKTVFFAGDLNAWVWKDESTAAEVNEAIDGFRRILADVRARYDRFDAALFPVDPRLGTDYDEGAAIFADTFRVERFIPMHFELWKDSDERQRFHSLVEMPRRFEVRYDPLTRFGQTLEMD